MRPLDKGEAPQDNGVDVQVREYAEWRMYLVERIGYYCAYCNIPLSHSLNVEHVVAKTPREGHHAGDYLAWENMLLACGPCNTAKGNVPTETDRFYLPETNNTLIPFDVQQHPENSNAAIVVPKSGLNELQKTKAQNTIELLGLDRIDLRNKVVDIRWKKRKAALLLAELSYELFSKVKASLPEETETAASHVARSAAETGFFMVWFKIFRNEPAVMEKLLDPEYIPGTAIKCFGEKTHEWLNRNPENNEDPI